MFRESLSTLRPAWDEPERRQPPRRLWRHKFGTAFRGMKRGVREQSSFFVHFFFAALALAGAVAFDCSLLEWCLLILCIGGVLTAELFNCALVALFRGVEETTQNLRRQCLDIAAGAVLVASGAALTVGTLIFGNQLIRLFS